MIFKKKANDIESARKAAYASGSLFTLDTLNAEVLRNIVQQCNNDPNLQVSIMTKDGNRIEIKTVPETGRQNLFSMFNSGE